MRLSDSLPIGVALTLAAFAALGSSTAETRQELRNFLMAAMEPRVADLGGDPGDFSGGAATVKWLPQANADPNE